MPVERDPKSADPAKADLRASLAADLLKMEAGKKKPAAAAPDLAEDDVPEDDPAEEPAGDEGEEPDPDEEPAEEAEPEGEADETEEEPAAEEPAPKAAPEPKPEPRVAKGLADLAKREAESRRAHQARLAEIQVAEQRLNTTQHQMRGQLEQQIRADVRRQALEDPVAFYKGLGFNKFQDLGAQFYYAELGAEAPPEVQTKARTFGLEQRVNERLAALDAREQKLNEEQAQRDMQGKVAAYQQQLLAALPTAAAAAPYLQKLAKKKPERAGDLMLRAANQFVANNPGVLPTAAQLVEDVEKYLQSELEPFSDTLKKKPTPAADEETEPAQTLTAQHSGRTPTKTAPRSRDELRAEVVREVKRRQSRS